MRAGAFMAIWAGFNGRHGFDPYPFILLNLFLSSARRTVVDLGRKLGDGPGQGGLGFDESALLRSVVQVCRSTSLLIASARLAEISRIAPCKVAVDVILVLMQQHDGRARCRVPRATQPG